MVLIGCDFHPSWQQVCWVDTGTGETEEHKLVHAGRVGQPLDLNYRVPAPSRFSKGLGLDSTILDLTVALKLSTGSFPPPF
jgi:hypothetical protein